MLKASRTEYRLPGERVLGKEESPDPCSEVLPNLGARYRIIHQAGKKLIGKK
jgi:hypothetical protein